jgi:hypothetical protein
MSTSAIIVVMGLEDICLFKQADGYPSSTLKWLQDFNKRFTQERGHDENYKFAQLVRSSATDAEKYNLFQSEFRGWGIYEPTEIGYDYKYILKSDGTVTIED